MSHPHSNNSSPKGQYEQLDQPNHQQVEQDIPIEHHHHHKTSSHLNPHEHEVNTNKIHLNYNNEDHLTEPVEQLINQQIPSESLQPNNLYIGNPLLDSQYEQPAAAHSNPALLNSNAVANQLLYSRPPATVSSPYVLQSRTLLSPARQFVTSTQQSVLSPSNAVHLKPKKLETQVKYEPYEKTIIQYEEVEKTIIEYQPVEKKIKVRIPVEKKVTDYRKREYVVYNDDKKEDKKAQVLPASYSSFLSTSKRTLTAPSFPVQSSMLSSTINYVPINNLRQNTGFFQSQVVRSPFQQTTYQATLQKNSAPISTKQNGETPRHAAVISPKATDQTAFFGSQAQQTSIYLKPVNTLRPSQQYACAPAPLTQSALYQTNLIRSQPFVTSNYVIAGGYQNFNLLNTSTVKPAWSNFNNGRVIQQQNQKSSSSKVVF